MDRHASFALGLGGLVLSAGVILSALRENSVLRQEYISAQTEITPETKEKAREYAKSRHSNEGWVKLASVVGLFGSSGLISYGLRRRREDD